MWHVWRASSESQNRIFARAERINRIAIDAAKVKELLRCRSSAAEKSFQPPTRLVRQA
jgi:hypothetical protein